MTLDASTINLMSLLESPPLTIFSELVGIITDTKVILVISLVLAAFLFYKHSRRKGIFLAATVLSTAILIKLLKELFQRARPPTQLITETGFSLPSGHTTMATVFFATLVYLFAKKKSKKTITLAVLAVLIIALTRLYLQVHYLTDVLAGFVLGAAILVIAILIDRKI